MEHGGQSVGFDRLDRKAMEKETEATAAGEEEIVLHVDQN